jgi:hypothetical protein
MRIREMIPATRINASRRPIVRVVAGRTPERLSTPAGEVG